MAAITLTVSFDAEQITEKLNWEFSSIQQDKEPIRMVGPATSVVPFKEGDTLNLVVRGADTAPCAWGIVQCHLITCPLLYSKRSNLDRAGEYPSPSPFRDHTAVIDFGAGNAVPTDAPGIKVWESDLRLHCENLGRWELSLILTVAILHKDARESTLRVFYFDPECEVGTGVGCPP